MRDKQYDNENQTNCGGVTSSALSIGGGIGSCDISKSASSLRGDLYAIIRNFEATAVRARQARELLSLLDQHPDLERFATLLGAVNPSSLR